MIILSFDPAAEREESTTGYAILRADEDSEPVLDQSGVIEGGFAGFVDFVNGPALTRTLPRPDVVVCESWVPYKGFVDSSPQLVEGVIRYVFPDVVLQPSITKAIITDDILKRLGWYSTEGHHRDANSAIAHALAYLVKIRHKPTIRLISA